MNAKQEISYLKFGDIICATIEWFDVSSEMMQRHLPDGEIKVKDSLNLSLKVITILAFICLTGYIFLNQQHCCSWEECPIGMNYEEFSDNWCIRDIHISNSDLSYENCEYILNVDCKDTTINYFTLKQKK